MGQSAPAHFARSNLVRTAVDRLAGRGRTTVAKGMRRQPVRGLHRVEARDDHGNVSTATVHVRFCRLTIHPSPGKRKRYGPLSLTVIHAIERGCPPDREPIRWKRLTDLPVDDLAAAVETLNWYAMRWKIESFHTVLKSGCRAEQSKLRTTARLTDLLAVLCGVGWRVFWNRPVNLTRSPTGPSSAAGPATVSCTPSPGSGSVPPSSTH